MTKTAQLRLRREIRRGATRIVSVLVRKLGGNRLVRYQCMALRGGEYVCGACGKHSLAPKRGEHCPCGAVVADVVKVIDPQEAERIRRAFVAMHDWRNR